jgi:hypothetical protein
VESILGPLGTAATTGLLYLPRVIARMEKLVEWTVLVGETELLGENLPGRHFVHHKSPLPDPGANPSHRGGKPATNRFSHGAASVLNKLLHSAEFLFYQQIFTLKCNKTLFENSVPTSYSSRSSLLYKHELATPDKGIIAVYSQNYTKP